jgi:cephalosporin-C deacetylase
VTLPRFDLSPDALRVYDPRPSEPDDLRAFWDRTLTETRCHPLDPVRKTAATPLAVVDSFDVSWRGFDGDRVHGWLHLPAPPLRDRTLLPVVVQFQGYGGGRGLVSEHVFWGTAGYAHLVMDTRGQGSGWSTVSPPTRTGAGPAQSGFFTRGMSRPDDYYYRRVYVDAVRAIEFVRTVPEVDGAAVVIAGMSQGGGIELAASALADGLAAAMIDVPFMCDVRRAAKIALDDPYLELVRYLACHRDEGERAFQTLAYLDGAVLARHATAPALFSVALMDETCPPSTVYAAYNGYAGPKEIVVYPNNNHEGGEAWQLSRQVAWLREHLGNRRPVADRQLSVVERIES